MRKLSLRTLKIIRNILVFGTIIGGLIIWFLIPDVIENSALIHVGNNKFGPKQGALVVLLLPLIALFIPGEKIELHGSDPVVQAEIIKEKERKKYTIQVITAATESIVVFGVLILALILG